MTASSLRRPRLLPAQRARSSPDSVSQPPRQPRLSLVAAGLVALLVSVNALPAEPPSWSVRTWQMEDGLPNNTVVGVSQTADGYLWIATRLMLARFDGTRVDPFPDLLGESTAGGRALHTGRNDTLWLATDPGRVMRLRAGKLDIIAPPAGMPDFVALTLVEGDDGTAWITGRGGVIARIAGDDMTLLTEEHGMPEGSADGSLVKDSAGRIWLARDRKLHVWRDGRFVFVHSLPEGIVRLAAARQGGLWVSVNLQLFSFDADEKLQERGDFETSPGYGNPSALLEGDQGAVWLGTSTGGLFRYDGVHFERIAIPNERVLTLHQDREGNLWVGTDGGLNRVRPRIIELETADTGPRAETIQSLCEDVHGVFWGATHGGLLVVRTVAGWTVHSATEATLSGSVSCVAADRDGSIWIGTSQRALYRLHDGVLSKWDAADGIAIDTIRALLMSSRGDIWMAGYHSSIIQCLRDERLLDFELPPNVAGINAMVEDVAGNVWVGAGHGVLLRIADDRVTDESARTWPLRKSIRTMYAGKDGALWLGYSGGGLGRLKQGRFTRLLREHGLPGNTVSQIVPDNRGWFWIGGDLGLFKVRGDKLDAVADGHRAQLRTIHFGNGDTLPNLRAGFGQWPSGQRSRDGRVWMPMRTALAVIDPDRVPEELKPPAVVVSRLAVDDRTIAFDGGVVPVREAIDLRRSPGRLRLPPGHRRLEFAFTALRSAVPEAVSFRYRLDGFDDDWVDAGMERKALFPRLPAGNYRFRVTAGNIDGVWNETGSTLAFTVAPFLWQTWWFRTGTLVLFTSLVIALARYVSFRRLRMQLRQVEQQVALDRERARIARDLHDDLGCGLTQVALVLDMTRRDQAPPDQQNQKIEQCSSMVRQVARSVDEIVWAINPRNDTVRYLIDYASQFAVEFLHAADIRCRMHLPDTLPEATVSPEARHNLFLVVKEALNNLTRHSHATEVHVRIAATANEVEFAIADNGRGFEPAPDNSVSDGLRNMRQRMEEIGGQFDIESKVGAGTRVTFSYSWALRT